MSFRLSRRTLLRGAGAAIALPFLDAMRPRRASAAPLPPRRFLLCYMPNGYPMQRWLPFGAAGGSLLDPLQAHARSLSVVNGLQNIAAGGIGAPGAHACATGGFATAVQPRRTEGDDVYNGISIDQRLAQLSTCATPLSSLVTGTQFSNGLGCQQDWGCLYTTAVSWVSPTTPAAKLVDPARVFDAMFGGATGGADSRAAQERRWRRRSILDTVRDQARSLSAQLGVNDRRRVDEYLEGVRVRALECRALHPQRRTPAGLERPQQGTSFETHVRLHIELAVLALRLDLTRVVSFMYGHSGLGGSYDFLGVTNDHHSLLHGPTTPETEAQLLRLAEFQVAQVKLFLDLLSEDHGEGPLLDSTLAYFGNEFSDAKAHDVEQLPVLLAGGANGAFRTGLTLDLAGRPLGDLYLTMLRGWGVQDDTFGTDGKAPITELLAG